MKDPGRNKRQVEDPGGPRFQGAHGRQLLRGSLGRRLCGRSEGTDQPKAHTGGSNTRVRSCSRHRERKGQAGRSQLVHARLLCRSCCSGNPNSQAGRSTELLNESRELLHIWSAASIRGHSVVYLPLGVDDVSTGGSEDQHLPKPVPRGYWMEHINTVQHSVSELPPPHELFWEECLDCCNRPGSFASLCGAAERWPHFTLRLSPSSAHTGQATAL